MVGATQDLAIGGIFSGGQSGVVSLIVGTIILLAVTFIVNLPIIIAVVRHTVHMKGIMFTNLFLWCIGIGWLAALVWAIVDKADRD